MTVSTLLKRIQDAKGTGGDKLYLSVYGEDRIKLVQEMILLHPAGTYTRTALAEDISKEFGPFTEADVTQKTLLGLRSLREDRVMTNFTLGLDEVILSDRSGPDVRLPKPESRSRMFR